MQLTHLCAPVVLALTASSFAANPIIPKVSASAVSQSNSLDIKSTTVRIDAAQPKALNGYRKQGNTPAALNQSFQNPSTMFLKRSNSISSSTLPLVSSQEFKPTSTILNHALILLTATTADPAFAATQEHRVESKSNRPDTQMLLAGEASLGRGIYIRYNRVETHYMAYSGWYQLASNLTPMVCGLIPNPYAAGGCGAAVATLQGRIQQTAAQAYENGKCLMIVTNYGGIPSRWEPYSGRSCR